VSDLVSGVKGFVINGSVANANVSFSISNAGDVNGDGLSDVILSGSNGSAYVVFGKTDGTAINLSAVTAGSGGFAINPEATGAIRVSNAGDVNGDGLADLIVGDRTTLSNAGRAYVVFGKTSTTALNLTAVAAGSGGFVMNGETALTNAYAGSSVSYAGDINGDGLADLLVGESGATVAGQSGAGKVFVVYGQTGSSAIELSAVASGTGGFAVWTGISGEGLGAGHATVSYAGDLNGDGYDDLIVSAPDADPVIGGTTLTNAGKTYVIYGGPTRISGNIATGTGTSADELVVGTNSNDTLTGNGGIDRYNAGRGDDVIVLEASDVSNLANNSSAAVKAMVDGGQGFDTIRLMNGGTLDLTSISNVSAGAFDGASRINSIERINMGLDVAANTLIIASRDVNDMAGFNIIHTGTASDDGRIWTNVTGTALGATTQFHQFVVDGTGVDTVNLKSGTGTWINAGTVKGGAVDYVVWQNTATKSQVIVNALVTVNANVAPVLLDLNRDGTIGYTPTVMDVNSDGTLDATHWAAPQDGVLVWDKYADGMVHDQSQFAFAQNGGTDLQGLAEVFDTNHDGQLNAADAKFAEFKVWQDANGNGVSDAGEVRSLADVGITSLNLVSDGVARTPAAGVHEAGRSTATMADGSTMVVADTSFDFHTATAAELASHGIAQGENVFKLNVGMSLDLSGVIQAAKLAAVDMSAEAAANTVKLMLSDLLCAAGVEAVVSGGAVHPFKLAGEVNDTAVFSANDWNNTGTLVNDNGHEYALYNASNGTNSVAAQLLFDQHMLVPHNG
jgi:hypothetical protein